MEIDYDKIDDTVLALLHLTMFPDHGITQSWKGHDWETMNQLHEKAMISDPRNKAKSITFTEEGVKRASELFQQLFQKAS